MVFSPRLRLAGGLPVDGFRSLLFSLFFSALLRFSIRLPVSYSSREKKSFLTIIFDISLIAGCPFVYSFFVTCRFVSRAL